MARKITKTGSAVAPGEKIRKQWEKLAKNDPGQPQLGVHVKNISKEVEKAQNARVKSKKPYKPIIGAVVGSVQSGKTSTMIGLSAYLFAQGYQVITILTGLRDDLRYQSARRFYRDLFDSGESTYELTGKATPRFVPVNPPSFTHKKGTGHHGMLDMLKGRFLHPNAIDIGHRCNDKPQYWSRREVGHPSNSICQENREEKVEHD